MSFEQLRCRVAVQTAFAEMFAAGIPALVVQESVQPSHESILILNEHQVYSRDAALFFAEPMNDHALFSQPNTIIGRCGLCFSSLFICDMGVGKSIPVKFIPSSMGYLDGLDTLHAHAHDTCRLSVGTAPHAAPTSSAEVAVCSYPLGMAGNVRY